MQTYRKNGGKKKMVSFYVGDKEKEKPFRSGMSITISLLKADILAINPSNYEGKHARVEYLRSLSYNYVIFWYLAFASSE